MTSSKIHCIIDCSGSMTEYGKPMLLINLLRYIRQFTARGSKSISYFSWRDNIETINWLVEADVRLPVIKGSSNIDSLCDWGEANNAEAILLVLTDGYFILTIEQRYRLAQLDNLYLVGVGGDANLAQLSTLSNYSFCAEELDHALHTICRPKTASVAPMTQVELIKVSVENESEDDEW